MALLALRASELLDRFASPDPTPGGGSAAALAGATAAALVAMVCRMPKTRTGDPVERARLDQALADARTAGDQCRRLVDEDSAAYDAVVAAYKLPRASGDEKAVRKRAVDAANSVAIDVPMRTAEMCWVVLGTAQAAAENGNPNAVSDARTAAALAWAGLRGAAENVRINAAALTESGALAVERVEAALAEGRTRAKDLGIP